MKSKTKFFIAGTILLLIISLLVYCSLDSVNPKENPREGMKDVDEKHWEQSDEFTKEEDEEIDFELSLIDKCDRSEWIELVSSEQIDSKVCELKEYTGSVTVSEIGTENDYFFEDGKKLIFPKKELGDFFEDEKLLISAYEKKDSLVVVAAKCLEEDFSDEDEEISVTEELKEFEQQAMAQIVKSADSLFKKEGSWEVVSFLWPDEDYVYAEFSAIEKNDNSEEGGTIENEEVESYLLLLKIAKEGQKILIEEIGLLKMDDEDEWIVERGRDLFENVDEESRLFDFNADAEKWIKVN